MARRCDRLPPTHLASVHLNSRHVCRPNPQTIQCEVNRHRVNNRMHSQDLFAQLLQKSAKLWQQGASICDCVHRCMFQKVSIAIENDVDPFLRQHAFLGYMSFHKVYTQISTAKAVEIGTRNGEGILLSSVKSPRLPIERLLIPEGRILNELHSPMQTCPRAPGSIDHSTTCRTSCSAFARKALHFRTRLDLHDDTF